jgi:hypothetical protein
MLWRYRVDIDSWLAIHLLMYVRVDIVDIIDIVDIDNVVTISCRYRQLTFYTFLKVHRVSISSILCRYRVDIDNVVKISYWYRQLNPHAFLYVPAVIVANFQSCLKKQTKIYYRPPWIKMKVKNDLLTLHCCRSYQMKITGAHPEIWIQDIIRSHSYLTCPEFVRERIMNRYRHDIVDIDDIVTKRNHNWGNQLWVDIDAISTVNFI